MLPSFVYATLRVVELMICHSSMKSRTLECQVLDNSLKRNMMQYIVYYTIRLHSAKFLHNKFKLNISGMTTIDYISPIFILSTVTLRFPSLSVLAPATCKILRMQVKFPYINYE